MYYKLEKRWEDISPDETLYREELAEDDDIGYTKQDLIALCKGKEDTAKVLFEALAWQSPYTLLDEWEREEEIDSEFNLIPQN